MVIAFPGLGSANMGVRQGLRCVMNWLGFIPKNMSQASKLTGLVKAHIDELNRSLPEGKKISLTLTGHSMGGGLASYAALRNKVPAVVINPMRLGWGDRARVSQSPLTRADRYLTEVTVQGDWVSDNPFATLYPSNVFDSYGPLGIARRFMVPNYGVDDPHNDVLNCLQAMNHEQEKLEQRIPRLRRFLTAPARKHRET